MSKTMTRACKFLVIAAVSFVGSAALMSDSAEAVVCRGRMAGSGTGMGLFGQGTALARQNALADWASKVGARHGQRFASTTLARSARYDCRTGAILQAQCVVSAIPCAESRGRRSSRKARR